jgi:hypothetical protein
VRILGLLLVLLTEPTLASDGRQDPSLDRFAYAAAYRFCLEHNDVGNAVNSVASGAAATHYPSWQTLVFVAPDRLLAASAEPPLVRVMSFEHREPDHASVALPIRAVRESKLDTVAPVGVDEVLHSRAPLEHLAALPTPMHLLPQEPPLETVMTETEPAAPPRPRLPHRHAILPHAKATAGAHKPPTPTQKVRKAEAKKPRIPRWAAQMFDNVWQRRAFAYQ